MANATKANTAARMAELLDVPVWQVEQMLSDMNAAPVCYADHIPFYSNGTYYMLQSHLSALRAKKLADKAMLLEKEREWLHGLPLWVVTHCFASMVSQTALRSLSQAGIKTFGQLVHYKGDLKTIKHIGPDTCRELMAVRQRTFSKENILEYFARQRLTKMGDKSKIAWTDATWNPVVGCSKVSEGCANCYALRQAASGRLQQFEQYREVVDFQVEQSYGRVVGYRWNGKTSIVKNLLEKPLHWKKPRRVFVCSMGDLFHESIPDEWIDKIFAIMATSRDHTFQVLTKRPERMKSYIDNIDFDRFHDLHITHPYVWSAINFLASGRPIRNIWLGVSAENQAAADERIPILLQTPAAKRFVSCEPLLGPVDLGLQSATCGCCDRLPSRWVLLPRTVRADFPFGGYASPGIYRAHSNNHGALSVQTPSDLLGIKPDEFECLPGLDWVIAGGESGPKARRMFPEWIESIRDQCKTAGVPFFFKQWGDASKRRQQKPPLLNGIVWDQFPGDRKNFF